MNINKNNYEAYFLDYHEGNLSPNQVAELLLFVEQHPELKEELESFENFTIEDYSSITFENKSSLKKEITDDNREEYFIRAVENTLSPIEKTLLENYLKQHPQYVVDFNLYKKTKLLADTSVIFENKEALRKALTPVVSTGDGIAGEALIAAVEGLLSKEETLLLNQKLAADIHLRKEYELYQKTKLTADASIVFENKESLKRKERKVVPFYYYVAAAAAVLLLFGLFFPNNNNNHEQFAVKNVPVINNKIENNNAPKTLAQANNHRENIANAVVSTKVKKLIVKHKETEQNNSSPIIITNTNPEINKKEEQPIVAETPKQELRNESEEPIIKKEEPTTKKEEFPSLTEIAISKLKESALDEKTLDAEKKSGRFKKFSGWDLAAVVAKGVSKLTGKEVKVEPHYNDAGDVTAYALGAGGFEISRGR